LKNEYKKIAVGGTFDKFHKGHEKLLSTAFEMGQEVLVGITSDDFASNKKHEIEKLSYRIQRINDFCSKFNKKYEIKEIFDSYGTADKDPDMEAIVVSKETEKTAELINMERLKNGLNLLDIIVIEWILAYDGNPISSTRIRKGEIDNYGDLL
jgi:pantetheine-phosphate adenylyltransferase